MNNHDRLPLKCIRVLDFGHYLAGPTVGMILADQGAEVIRIDSPSGTRWQNQANAILGRGKKSIILDLKTDEGRSIAENLAARSDLLVENFRPGSDGPTGPERRSFDVDQSSTGLSVTTRICFH